jgi:pimeloyl-ACP methyl ester carboxylesterase
VAVQPFRIDISDDALADLHRRLAGYRPATALAGDPWESGVDHQVLGELIAYWDKGFDWRDRERWLSSFPQVMVEVGEQMIHAVHLRADPDLYEDPVPIVLSHGWPYSFIEFLDFSTRLSDPLSHGGGDGDAFDVVIPSLPGHGFSAALRDESFTGDVVARLWHRLMTEGLGYERYATYGEDVGTTVSDWTAALFPDQVMGLFSTHAAFPPKERTLDLSPAEEEFRMWLDEKWESSSGYSAIQSTRPDTLAVGLNDSPAGLLAWMLEKFHEWSGPGFAEVWSDDEILTTVSLYWFTETIGSSFLPYYHGRRHEKSVPMIDVPVGVAVQWGERGFPREYAERTYTDVRQWEDLPEGGHFTAKQSPDLVADAMRRFFAPLLD